MANKIFPVLYILDFNVGNETDDPNDPYNAGRIAVGHPSSNKLKTLLDHEHRPDGIDVLLEDGGHVIWTQMGIPQNNDGIVQSCRLDGTSIRDIFSEGEIHTPKQISIDRTNHKVYVCDREGLRVHRCNLDGTQKEVLVQTEDWRNEEHMKDSTRWCVGVCVDPTHGYLYWTQKGPSKGGKGRIFRARIDMPKGQTADNRTDIEILFENLPEPIDLEIDTSSQTLYWTDRGDFPKGNTLDRADVSGIFKPGERHPYAILARHLHEAIGIKIDNVNQNIYVTDLGGAAYRYDMDGQNGERLFEGQGVYAGISLAHLDEGQAKELYGFQFE